MGIKVDAGKCPQDHKCPAIKVCPVQVITQIGNGLPTVDNKLCIECEKCISYCPMGAFVMED